MESGSSLLCSFTSILHRVRQEVFKLSFLVVNNGLCSIPMWNTECMIVCILHTCVCTFVLEANLEFSWDFFKDRRTPYLIKLWICVLAWVSDFPRMVIFGNKRHCLGSHPAVFFRVPCRALETAVSTWVRPHSDSQLLGGSWMSSFVVASLVTDLLPRLAALP